MTDEAYTPEEQALLADLDRLLADEALWALPSEGVEHDVVAAIRSEQAALESGAATRTYHVARPASRRRRWLATAGAAAVGAAAAAIVTVMVLRDDNAADQTVAMAGTDLAPGVSGSAELTVVSSGVRIDLRIPGLPRRDGGEFYQVWLKSCDGTQLVPAGSFHELNDAIAWAGVSPVDFPLLTVTREVVAPPKDAAQGSSGEVVAAGAIGECPG